jgi:transcriptional regulator with XRE-family HTH domain
MQVAGPSVAGKGNGSRAMAKDTKTQNDADAETDEVIRIIAQRLAEARKKRGFTQKELGQVAGVAQSRIFELEQGTANVTVRTLVNMARLLAVDPRSLFPDIGPIEDGQLADALARIRQLAEDLLRVMKAVEERSKSDGKLSEEIEAILGLARQLAVRRAVTEDDGAK